MTEAPPIWGTLGSEENRNWIANNISRDTWETMSGSAILGELKELGMGIRRQDFFAIRREVMELGYYEEAISKRAGNTLIPRAWMHERKHVDLTLNAQYRFLMDVTDVETGKTDQIIRAISSDRHFTKDEAEDFIRGLYTRPMPDSDYIVTNVRSVEVWVKPGASLTR